MPGEPKIRTRLLLCSFLAVVVTVSPSAVSPPSTIVSAQSAIEHETFEVVSIRRNERDGRTLFRVEPSGLNATNVTVLDLIKYAFRFTERDIVGDLPGWIKASRFDVVARTATGPLTPSRLRAMTKALLEDRFRLTGSREQAVGPIYALSIDRSDGRLGPRLLVSQTTCKDALLDLSVDTSVKVLNVGDKCGMSNLTLNGGLVGLFGLRVTMEDVAVELSRVGRFDRPVVDRTGLDGEFDLAVAPTADMVAPTSQALFLIALREQLGLVFRSEEGPYDVFRIRRIEQPSPN